VLKQNTNKHKFGHNFPWSSIVKSISIESTKNMNIIINHAQIPV